MMSLIHQALLRTCRTSLPSPYTPPFPLLQFVHLTLIENLGVSSCRRWTIKGSRRRRRLRHPCWHPSLDSQLLFPSRRASHCTGKPGMTRDDLFKINAGIVRDLVSGIAKFCPKAFVLVISNPVNSTVPIAAEVLKQHNVFDPKKLFGVTTLDVVRAETFVQDITGERDPSKTVIPVIGGHSGETIVPLFSQAKPAVKIPEEKLAPLVKRSSFLLPPLLH